MHLRTKIGIWVIGGLVAIIVALAAFAQFGSEIKRHRLVDVAVDSIVIPTDQAALERGRYLFRSRGCADCHGSDGGGRVFLDESGLRAKSPHISPGPGSVTVGYAAEDWVRTIRHGVKPNGEPLLIMPSEDFDRFTDADVGAIAAYVRSLPAVEGTGAEFDIPLPMRLLYAAGMIQDAAEKIDHTLAPQQPPAPTDRLAAGAYVAEICKGCHNDAGRGRRARSLPFGGGARRNVPQRQAAGRQRHQRRDARCGSRGNERRRDFGSVRVPEEPACQEDRRALGRFRRSQRW
jgi:mono/diheme cytochrome c family protein